MLGFNEQFCKLFKSILNYISPPDIFISNEVWNNMETYITDGRMYMLRISGHLNLHVDMKNVND